MEKKVAEEIASEIKHSVREALADFGGVDFGCCQKFYEYFYEQQKRVARISGGLSLRTVEEMVVLVGRKSILPIGKELFGDDVQYVIDSLDSSDTRERSQLRVREKEEERKEKQEREDEIEEELEIDLLAKLFERKQKRDAKEIFRGLLICLVAARMDPRYKAGENVKSDARSAETYRRAGSTQRSC